MYNSSFQLNKARRAINTCGQVFEFTRKRVNEFGEPTNDNLCVIELKGLYHEQTGYLYKSAVESTTIRQRSSPMILCLWKEQGELLSRGDLVEINSNTYKISEIKNIAEASIVADVSLEEVQQ